MREYTANAAVVSIERLSAALLTRGHRGYGNKDLRRALAECGYQRWQGGGDKGRATVATGTKNTIFTKPHLNNELHWATLTPFMP